MKFLMISCLFLILTASKPWTSEEDVFKFIDTVMKEPERLPEILEDTSLSILYFRTKNLTETKVKKYNEFVKEKFSTGYILIDKSYAEELVNHNYQLIMKITAINLLCKSRIKFIFYYNEEYWQLSEIFPPFLY